VCGAEPESLGERPHLAVGGDHAAQPELARLWIKVDPPHLNPQLNLEPLAGRGPGHRLALHLAERGRRDAVADDDEVVRVPQILLVLGQQPDLAGRIRLAMHEGVSAALK